MPRNRRRADPQEAESSSSATRRSIEQQPHGQEEEEAEEDEVEDELLGLDESAKGRRRDRSMQSAFLRALSPPLPSGIDGNRRWDNSQQAEENRKSDKGKGKEKAIPDELSPAEEIQDRDHDGADLMCRICWCGDLEEEEGPQGRLIAPCGCSGTSKYIHKSCLKEWRQKGGGSHSRVCPQCDCRYKMEASPRMLLLIWATNNELLRMLITVFAVSLLVLVTGALGALLIPSFGYLTHSLRRQTLPTVYPRFNITLSPDLNRVRIELFRDQDNFVIVSGVGTLHRESLERHEGQFYLPSLQEEARANALRMVELEMEMEPNWLQQCRTTEIAESTVEDSDEDPGSNLSRNTLWDHEPHTNATMRFLPQREQTPLPIFRSLEVFPPTRLEESLLKLDPSAHQTVFRMNSLEANDSLSLHSGLLSPLWTEWAGLNSSSSDPKASDNLKACQLPGVHRKAFTIEYVWKPRVILVPEFFKEDDQDLVPANDHPLMDILPDSYGIIKVLPVALWMSFVTGIKSAFPEMIEATARAASQLFWLVASREAAQELAWSMTQVILHGSAAFLIEYSAMPGLKARNPVLHKAAKYGSHSIVFCLGQVFGAGRGGPGSMGEYPLTVYQSEPKSVLPIDLLVFYSIFAPRFILPAQYLLGFLLWAMTFSDYLEGKVRSTQEDVRRMQNSDWNMLDNSAAIGYSRLLDGLSGGSGSEPRPYDLYQLYHKQPVDVPGKVRPYDLARVVKQDTWTDFLYLSIYLGCLFVAIGSYFPALRWTYRHGLRHVIQEGRLHLFRLRSLLWTYFKTISRFSINFWNRILPTLRTRNRRIAGEAEHQAEAEEHLPSLGTQLTDISSALGWLYVSSLYVFRALQQVTWWLCIVPHMTVADWIENYLSSIVISQEVLDRSGR